MLVALSHYSGSILTQAPEHNILHQFFAAFGGYTGVAIFFFLSGYGLMMSELRCHLQLAPFVKRRLLRVYAPVVMVSAIWGIVRWPEGGGLDHVTAFLHTALWTFGDGILWFIRVIALLYVAFAAYACLPHNPRLRLPLLAVATAAMYAYVYVAFASWCAISVPLFSLGIVTAEHSRTLLRFCRSAWVVVWLVAITALMAVLYARLGNLYLHTLCNYYVLTAILLAAAYLHPQLSVAPMVGSASYDLYLTHNKVLVYCTPIYGYVAFHHFFVGALILTLASNTLRRLLHI